ncbi:hydrogenase 3 maturation endopeptidase HyCI [Candidatus Bipolaricaulota sp. J31]
MEKVLLGVGNPLARDDGVGVWVAERFRGDGWVSIPAGQAPENVLGKIARLAPRCLVVVDAVEMGLAPGEVRRIPWEPGRAPWGSTHSLPLSALFLELCRDIREVILIGVQPKDLSLGEGLSPEVAAAARELLGVLERGDLAAIPELRPGKGRWGG